MLRVRLQVEVGAVGNPLQLSPRIALETELVLDVDGAVRVVRQLLFGMFVKPKVLRFDAEVDVPLHPGVDPVLMPVAGGVGFDEELHLHLLELAGAEDEVARRDLVTEALADLADAERRLTPGSGDDVGEVDENALRGFRTQIVHPLLGLDRTEVSLEHHVEVAGLSPLPLGAAVRAGDVGHRHRLRRRDALLGTLLFEVRLLHVVLPVPLVAVQALNQWIVEHLNVTRGDPHLTRQDDRGVQAHDIVAAGHHRLPPLPFDVLLEFHAQRPVVPRRLGPAVDLAGLVHQPAALGQIDDGIDDGRHVRCTPVCGYFQPLQRR